MYFCMTKSSKSHLRGSLLEISLPFPALPKRAQRLFLCQRTDFMHARHTFICGRGTSAYANLLDSFV